MVKLFNCYVRTNSEVTRKYIARLMDKIADGKLYYSTYE